MKFQLRNLACLVMVPLLVTADPPALFTLSAAAPNTPSLQASLSRYCSEAVYAQLGLDAGLTRFHSRWASLGQVALGMGLEHESSSHLFYRTSAAFGIGYIVNPGDLANQQSDWYQTARITPQVVWYPSGRFSGASVGFSLGLHLEYRASLTDRPLPGGLPGTNAQLVAGLVL